MEHGLIDEKMSSRKSASGQKVLPDRYYKPTDLLNITKKLSVRDRLVASIMDAFQAMEIRSNIVEDYFYEVNITHVRNSVRLATKFLIIYYFGNILFAPIITPGDSARMQYSYFSVSLFMVVNIITFRESTTHHTYQFMAIALSVAALCLVLLDVTINEYPMEVHYTPGIQIVILMYAILPMRLAVCLSLTLIFTVCFEIVANSSYKNYDKRDLTGVSLFTFIQKRGQIQFKNSLISRMEYVYGQCFLWLACHSIGIYLHISHSVRRRASFLRLGENIAYRKEAREANERQNRLVEAIMPTSVKEDYLREFNQQLNQPDDADMWVYSKMYNNVSILFADIVGFTNMSSNKDAVQIVTLLNDLFNRFDDMARMTDCEKIGTLGDCYYCIAGCPTPTNEHATSCIEMGLGMCRIILEFNKDHNESVNMRVGVHTGRVNAAIIGKIRFRFDVYSFDVIVANRAESTGQPGLVHITHSTYREVRSEYKFKLGEPMIISVEMPSGTLQSGIELQNKKIKTYFVDPKTSILLRKGVHTLGKKHDAFFVETTVKESDNIEYEDNDEFSASDKSSATKTSTAAQFDFDVMFINNMRQDPENNAKILSKPPIWPLTMKFIDTNMETIFQNNILRVATEAMFIDSVRIVPFLDRLFSMLFSLAVIIASNFLLGPEYRSRALGPLAIMVLQATLVGITFWHTFSRLDSFVIGSILFRFHSLLSNWFVDFLIGFLFHLSIIFIPISGYSCESIKKDYFYTMGFFSVSFFCTLTPLINMGTPSIINIIIGLLKMVFFLLYIWYRDPCVEDSCRKQPCSKVYCSVLAQFNHDRPLDALVMTSVLAFFQTFVFIIQMTRNSEFILRLVSCLQRQTKTSMEEAKKSRTDAETLLKNIIPSYVMESLLTRKGEVLDVKDLNYAVLRPNAAVIFARVCNFFDKFYREDFRAGESALRLLNKIVTTFDDISKIYPDVEKIKTINDCYMAASGLNPARDSVNPDQITHAVALMDYAFQIMQALQDFNRDFVIDFEFYITIGYNIGPLTAGIIGEMKPLFDIWGDTVNVASRMYSSASKGTIQVDESTANKLKGIFHFKYKGNIEIKGKGKMNTFICTHKKNTSGN